MRRMRVNCLVAVLALCLAASLAACQSAGTRKSTTAKPVPSKKIDPMKDLAERLFILKEGRDMHLVVLRLNRQGIPMEHLREEAQNITMASFESWMARHCEAKRLVYLGGGRFRMDVLSFILEPEQFEQAQMTLQLKAFELNGKRIEGIILEKVLLDGREFTALASLKIYEGMLEAATYQ